MTQFKIGSMVVHSEGVGIIKRYEPSLALSPLFVKFEHCNLWIKTSEVKCVRNPRKGGKEARDIVAKLCLMYLNHKIYTKNNHQDVYKYWDYFNKEHSIWDGYHEVPDKDFFSKKEEGVLASLLALQKCYEKAKSMLNEDL